jgi:hypothetical protein
MDKLHLINENIRTARLLEEKIISISNNSKITKEVISFIYKSLENTEDKKLEESFFKWIEIVRKKQQK